MERKIVIFLFCILCLSSYAQTKGVKCTYVSTMPVTPGFLEISDSYVRNVMIERLKTDEKVYTLTVANGQSLFVKEPESVDKMPLEVDVMQTFIDFNDSISISQKKYGGKLYIIKNHLNKTEWTISKSEEKILGHICYKAILTNDTTVTAWFTTEIPISHAPLGYYGLPGLVVRLATPVYILNLQDIIETHDIKFEIPKKGITMSEVDFDKLIGINYKKISEGESVKVIE